MRFSEKDWQIFRRKIVEWQEDYMARLIREYIRLLTTDEEPSTRFWNLAERMQQDKKKAGVQAKRSRSNMFNTLLMLLDEGAITPDDLSEFSENLQECIKNAISWNE